LLALCVVEMKLSDFHLNSDEENQLLLCVVHPHHLSVRENNNSIFD